LRQGAITCILLREYCNAPPPLRGAGLAQGGRYSHEKRFSSEQFFQSNPEYFFFIATMIVIENMIRINQTLIENFQADFDLFFSIKP
jgi:hypothetical protein